MRGEWQFHHSGKVQREQNSVQKHTVSSETGFFLGKDTHKLNHSKTVKHQDEQILEETIRMRGESRHPIDTSILIVSEGGQTHRTAQWLT